MKLKKIFHRSFPKNILQTLLKLNGQKGAGFILPFLQLNAQKREGFTQLFLATKGKERAGFTPLENDIDSNFEVINMRGYHYMEVLGKQWKKHSLTGFTLFELILVILIIAVIFIVGARYTVYAVDAKKYTRTVDKMITIKRAIIGDERLNNLGLKPDFGYFERFAAFPAAEAGNTVPTTALADFFPPTPYTSSYDPYKVDEWGNDFYYATTGTNIPGTTYDTVEIKSWGKDGADDSVTTPPTIFDAEFHILIRKDLYESNHVFLNVMDINGTILRGYSNPFGQSWGAAGYDHQIYRVYVTRINGAETYDTNTATITYDKGLFEITGITCGLFLFHVYPTTGGSTNVNGWFDHRNDLSGGEAGVCQVVPIYPKDPNTPNFVEFRLPGVVDKDELDYP